MMIEKKVALVTEVSSGIRPATAEKNVGSGGMKKELDDLFSSLNIRQNMEAADILAALACLTVGSGSEEV